MSSENRLIYYSTIYLSRREEILIQSIISLYTSKDNYKWIQKDSNDTAVVIVGSDVKAIIESGRDPFLSLTEQQIVCVLGDTFFSKNARAVVQIALPIKALHLVDKLSHIEKNIINKPFSIGYVAANHMVSSIQNSINKRTTVQDTFINVVDNRANLSKLEKEINASVIDRPTANILDKYKLLDKTQYTDNSSLAAQIENKQRSMGYEIAPSPSFFENNSIDFVPKTIARENVLKENSQFSKNIEKESIQSEPKPNKITFESVDVSHVLSKYQLMDKNLSLSPSVPDITNYSINIPNNVVSNAIEYSLSQKNNNGIDLVTKVENILFPVVKESDKPITDIVESDINSNLAATVIEGDVPSLVQEGDSDTVDDVKVPPSKIDETPILTDVVSPIVLEAVTQSKTIKEVPVLTDEQKVPTDPVTQPLTDVSAFSCKRIKLSRWPKSEVIRRHPGNAILASMVINMPMSVEDMAEQSDLPLQVCQRFVDAVIESNVADYVDAVEEVVETTITPLEEQKEKEEPKENDDAPTKRKGILYRIRAALGLLRN